MYNDDFFRLEMHKIKELGLYREIRKIEKIEGKYINIAGKSYIDFSSNNYLGLRDDKRIILSGKEAAEKYGAGSGASRVVTGNSSIYSRLEEKIAEFKGKDKALIFNSGYDANIAIFSSIFDESDIIFADKLIHASIIDGIKLSGAKLLRYKHNDIADLKIKMAKYSGKYKKIGVVTESVFSMDGDIGKIKEISDLKKIENFIFIVDEAHATGIFGERGSGVIEELGLEKNNVDVIMGTLGKALGSYGAYIAADSIIVEFLINRARPFIFSTALPPFSCGAALKAIELIMEKKVLTEKLYENIMFARKNAESSGFALPKDITPIVPLIIGSNSEVVKLQKLIFDNGYVAAGIRPPTVPEGKSRIRLTINPYHDREDIEGLFKVVHSFIKEK